MSNALIIDTSREFILVGLVKGEDVIFKRVNCDRNFSVYLLNTIIEVLNENNVSKDELSAIYCGSGPGTFTGIRLALSIAKTMSYALNIELYSISSLIFYSLFVKNDKVISIDDARSYKFYYGIIDKSTLEYSQGIDEDPIVVDFCDLRDDYLVISTREFLNISTTVLTDFSYFDLEALKKLATLENYFAFKPNYIKKLDNEK